MSSGGGEWSRFKATAAWEPNLNARLGICLDLPPTATCALPAAIGINHEHVGAD
jgi:hypothetical protein